MLRSYAGREGLPETTRLNILGCLSRAGDSAAQSRLLATLNETGPVDARLAAAAKLAQLGEPTGCASCASSCASAVASSSWRHTHWPSKTKPMASICSVSSSAIARRRSRPGSSPPRAWRQWAKGRCPGAQRALAAWWRCDAGPRRSPRNRADRQPRSRPAVRAELGLGAVALADSDAQLRQSAAEILGNNLCSGAVSLLSGLLHDSDARVRRSVVAAPG